MAAQSLSNIISIAYVDRFINIIINPLHSEGKFSCQSQPMFSICPIVHSCLGLTILIKMSTNKHGHKSVVLEYSAKPRVPYRHPWLGLAEDSRTTGSDSGCNFA